MTRADYDVIIVGARCAGATLGVLLARRGARVLLLDRDRLPSDHVISTHTIHPAGMDVLAEAGVADDVQRYAPAARVFRLAKDEVFVDVELPPGRVECCPRRARLDGLLQEAAVCAGAELMDRTRVVGLIERDGRVAGVRAGAAGAERAFTAPIVVGADGRHSTVASLTGADEYLAYDAPRGMYWSYWDAPPVWSTDAYPFDMSVANRGGAVRVIFRTDHGMLLIGSAPPVEICRQWRSDPDASLLADLRSDPVTGPLVEAPPSEKVRGTVSERYYFRRAAGPGWVLAGDAGHHKDFVIGDGMTEALLQVRGLTEALAEGTDLALERWWRARDVAALPMYYFGQDEGRPGPPAALQRVVFTHAAKSPALRARIAAVVDHTVSPLETFTVGQLARWVLGAAARGHLRVVPEFLAGGRLAAARQKELQYRQALLDELPSARPSVAAQPRGQCAL
jgi:menaquinone-9 beta-reductase